MTTKRFRADKERHIARTKVKTLLPGGLGKILMPVPSPGEQERIVAILEEFDALVSGLSSDLSSELRARRIQYEFYRNELLTFEEIAA
jgi:type I restriction enzyme S subunit